MSSPVSLDARNHPIDLARATTRRLTSIDALRGLVMILMALDHVRDFFGVPGVSPTDLGQTTVPLVPHALGHAPLRADVLPADRHWRLSGAAAGSRRRAVARFSSRAGLWLILLELTVIRCLAYQFNFDYRVTMLLVLWALGWAMIALAGLVWLPAP